MSRAEARVVVAEEGVPEIALEGVRGSVQRTDVLFVQAVAKKLSIADYKFAWKVDCANCIIGDPENDFIYVNVSNVILTEDSTFEIAVEATNQVLSMKKGEAKLEVKVDQLPGVGELICSATEGYSWYTHFVLEAIGFSSTEPLYYEFIYYCKEKQRYAPLTIKNEQSRLETVLPTGVAEEGYMLEVGVRVYNEKGGWVQKSVKVKCKELITQTLSPVQKYDLINSMKDLHNPLSVLERDLLVSYAVAETPAVPYKTYENDTICNQQELWLHMDCIRHLVTDRYAVYGEVASEFLEEILVSEKLLDTVQWANANEASLQKYQAMAQIVMNIAGDANILTEVSRHYARLLLAEVVSKGASVDYDEFAVVLDNLALLSTDITKQESEFELMKTLIAGLIDGDSETEIQKGDNFRIERDMVNFRVDATLVQGSYDLPVELGRVTFPSPKAFLESDSYLYLSVIEWRIRTYTWIEDIDNIKSGIFTISAKYLNKTDARLTDLRLPVSIEFPLNLDTISAKDLNILRCLYFDVKASLFSSANLVSDPVDTETGVGKCYTTHLSDFAMGISTRLEGLYPIPREKEELPHDEGRKLYAIYKSPLFYFSISLGMIFLYLMLWGHCKEKAETELVTLMRSRLYAQQKNVFQDGFSKRASEESKVSKSPEDGSPETLKTHTEMELKSLRKGSSMERQQDNSGVSAEESKDDSPGKTGFGDTSVKDEYYSQDEIKVTDIPNPRETSETQEAQYNVDQTANLKYESFCVLFLVLSIVTNRHFTSIRGTS